MILYIVLYSAVVLMIIFVLLALISPSYKNPLLGLVLIRPLVDATWNYRFFSVSLIYILNGAFILIFLIRLFIKKERIYKFPHMKLFIVYLHLLFFVSFHIYMNSNALVALEFLFKSLFMPLSFYLCYVYFGDEKSGKAIITTLILAGIFPLFFNFYQKFFGHIWYLRETRGLIRSTGLYHDVVTSRVFLMQALIGIMIFWHYFLKKDDRLKKVALAILFVCSILGLYFLFSKAIIITLMLWVLLYTFLKGKIYLLPLVLVLLLFVNHFTENRIYNEVNQVFSRETEFVRGELETDYVLSGRGKIWRVYLRDWLDLPIIQKVVGKGISHGYFHNDYLRILFAGGLLLLGFYLLITISLVSKVAINFLRNRKFLYFAVLLPVIYFFIESIGQLPGFYPDIQLFTWGLVGLSFNSRLKWINKNSQQF